MSSMPMTTATLTPTSAIRTATAPAQHLQLISYNNGLGRRCHALWDQRSLLLDLDPSIASTSPLQTRRFTTSDNDHVSETSSWTNIDRTFIATSDGFSATRALEAAAEIMSTNPRARATIHRAAEDGNMNSLVNYLRTVVGSLRPVIHRPRLGFVAAARSESRAAEPNVAAAPSSDVGRRDAELARARGAAAAMLRVPETAPPPPILTPELGENLRQALNTNTSYLGLNIGMNLQRSEMFAPPRFAREPLPTRADSVQPIFTPLTPFVATTVPSRTAVLDTLMQINTRWIIQAAQSMLLPPAPVSSAQTDQLPPSYGSFPPQYIEDLVPSLDGDGNAPEPWIQQEQQVPSTWFGAAPYADLGDVEDFSLVSYRKDGEPVDPSVRHYAIVGPRWINGRVERCIMRLWPGTSQYDVVIGAQWPDPPSLKPMADLPLDIDIVGVARLNPPEASRQRLMDEMHQRAVVTHDNIHTDAQMDQYRLRVRGTDVVNERLGDEKMRLRLLVETASDITGGISSDELINFVEGRHGAFYSEDRQVRVMKYQYTPDGGATFCTEYAIVGPMVVFDEVTGAPAPRTVAVTFRNGDYLQAPENPAQTLWDYEPHVQFFDAMVGSTPGFKVLDEPLILVPRAAPTALNVIIDAAEKTATDNMNCCKETFGKDRTMAEIKDHQIGEMLMCSLLREEFAGWKSTPDLGRVATGAIDGIVDLMGRRAKLLVSHRMTVANENVTVEILKIEDASTTTATNDPDSFVIRTKRKVNGEDIVKYYKVNCDNPQATSVCMYKYGSDGVTTGRLNAVETHLVGDRMTIRDQTLATSCAEVGKAHKKPETRTLTPFQYLIEALKKVRSMAQMDHGMTAASVPAFDEAFKKFEKQGLTAAAAAAPLNSSERSQVRLRPPTLSP